MALLTAWSYSRYADYKQCPLRFKLKYLDKVPEGEASPAMERGSTIHKEGELYLKDPTIDTVPASYQHFAEEMKQLKSLSPMVEQQWGFTKSWEPTDWFGKKTWVRIIADVAVLYDDDTAEVIDFKTGRKYDINEEQVELFGAATLKKFSNLKEIQVRLWYLDQPTDNEVLRTYTAKDGELIRKDWEKKVVPMFNDRRFAPTPNTKCRWCSYAKDKGGPCPYNSG
jgi:RecB family exonuclease